MKLLAEVRDCTLRWKERRSKPLMMVFIVCTGCARAHRFFGLFKLLRHSFIRSLLVHFGLCGASSLALSVRTQRVVFCLVSLFGSCLVTVIFGASPVIGVFFSDCWPTSQQPKYVFLSVCSLDVSCFWYVCSLKWQALPSFMPCFDFVSAPSFLLFSKQVLNVGLRNLGVSHVQMMFAWYINSPSTNREDCGNSQSLF